MEKAELSYDLAFFVAFHFIKAKVWFCNPLGELLHYSQPGQDRAVKAILTDLTENELSSLINEPSARKRTFALPVKKGATQKKKSWWQKCAKIVPRAPIHSGGHANSLFLCCAPSELHRKRERKDEDTTHRMNEPRRRQIHTFLGHVDLNHAQVTRI